MYDFHIHSTYSNDAYPWASMENMCNTAILKGLEGICFTDHIDFDYPGDEEMFDISDYFNSIKKVKELYNTSLKIYKGIELGLQPHLYDRNLSVSSNPSLDFVLGSIHLVRGKELYRNSYLEGISDHKGILNYFKDLEECLNNFSDFDCLGHIDGVRRSLNNGEKSFSYNKYKDEIYDILQKLISMEKGIEVNTSGKRYGLSDFHPLKNILALYKSLGGEIITLGSDAHRPEDLAYDFQNALYLLKEIGYDYYCIFEKRKPSFIKID